MDTLPEELVSYIISYLDLRCQLRLSTVSVWWRAAVSDCLRRRQRLELDDRTDAELRTLLPRLPGIRAFRTNDVLGELDVDIVYVVNELDVNIVSENCPLLEKLDLTPFRLDTDSLERLCRRCPRLWDVRLQRNCEPNLLELLLRRLPGIRALSLFETDISAVAVALMPACLRRLELICCEMLSCERQSADQGLQPGRSPANGLDLLVARCPALTALLGGDPFDVDNLAENCPRLEEVDLFACQLDTDSLERLCRRCPRLWNVSMPRDCSSILVELLLRRLPGLRSLTLVDMDVSAAVVALFPVGLERLKLGESCRLLTGERQPADRWPRLTELDVMGLECHGSPEWLATALVAGCPRLQWLTSALVDSDDRLLELLPALPLQFLDVSICKNLTEDGLVSCLGRLRQLRTLRLSGVPSVTDRVLDSLVGVESLVELELGEEEDDWPVPFTMEAVQRLVVASSSLRKLKLNIRNEEQVKSLIVGLASDLDQYRDITLAIPKVMLKKLAESGLPSQSSPLRVVRLF